MTTPNEELLELLACPKCHGGLEANADPEGFACAPCSLFYRVDDGLPNMLVDEARPWPLTDGDTAS